MDFLIRIGYILKETFSSTLSNSYIAERSGDVVVLRKGGSYQGADLHG